MSGDPLRRSGQMPIWYLVSRGRGSVGTRDAVPRIDRSVVRMLRPRYYSVARTAAMASRNGFNVRRQRTGTPLGGAYYRRLIAIAAITCAVVVAGCGSSRNNNQPAHQTALLPFSECMRSHGAPSFPDPSPGGGIHLSSGMNPSAPAFKAAQASCHELLPGGGPGAERPSAQAEAQTLKISDCMRQHGVAGFPDPTLSVPSSPAGYSIVEDRGGVVLAVPSTINPASPVFKQAEATCGFH